MAVKTKDYEKIARERISKPSTIKKFPRIFIIARNKKGKTHFSLSAGVENTLILDPEHGTDEMKKADPNVWHIERWEDIDDALNYLRFSTHPYSWVSIDGLTKLANMALKYVMKLQEDKSLDRIPGMVQQKDYGKAGELMKDMINRAHALQMGVIFTAQERQEGAFDSEEDEDVEDVGAMYVADLPKGVRAHVNSVVDVIGRLYIVRVDGKSERRLWIGESLKYDTGYRSDYELPDILKRPSVPRLVRLMRTGSAVPPKKPAVAAKK